MTMTVHHDDCVVVDLSLLMMSYCDVFVKMCWKNKYTGE